MIVYDNQFDLNEWYILTGLFMGIILFIFLPKRFPKKITILFTLCGVFTGFFIDHSLSVEPVNFYDVNDSSHYEIMDFVSYLSYGPISYLFFYLYDRLRPISIPFYVLIWSLLSVGMEWISLQIGVFHYRHGYNLSYSLFIYLIVKSIWIMFYNRYWGNISKPVQSSSKITE